MASGGPDSILNGGDGNDSLDSGSYIVASTGALYSRVATLNGDDGYDTLRGRGTLDGGEGNDTLTASASTDGLITTLTGGAGTDAFHVGQGFTSLSSSEIASGQYDAAVITDFDPATETLQLTVTTDTVDQTLLSTQTAPNGTDLQVILTDAAGHDFVAAVLQGVAGDQIIDGSITLVVT